MKPELERLAAIEEERREAAFRYRRAHRPFRRAFGGIVSGERDRRILHAAGAAMAREKLS